MKLSLKGLIVATIAVASSASRVDTSNFETLEIQVACQGIDYDSLSSKALGFSAKTLEDAFQSSHKDAKGLELFHVSSSIPLIQSNNLRGKESLNFIAKIPLADGDLGGDDHGCRLCGSDEAAAQLVEAGKLKVWEAIFASSIASSPFDALKKANSCNFKMFSNDADFEALATPFAVDLNVQCDNVNFAELPIKAMAYATKSLQETYDSVHSAVDGSKMTNIAMSGNRLRVGDLGGDDHGCRLCDEQKIESWDIVTFTANGLTSEGGDLGGDDHGCRLCGDVLDAANEEMLKAWEGLFLARLLKESRGSFKDAKHCSISMKEKETTEMA